MDDIIHSVTPPNSTYARSPMRSRCGDPKLFLFFPFFRQSSSSPTKSIELIFEGAFLFRIYNPFVRVILSIFILSLKWKCMKMRIFLHNCFYPILALESSKRLFIRMPIDRFDWYTAPRIYKERIDGDSYYTM